MRTSTTFKPGQFADKTARALELVADAPRGISRRNLAKVMGVRDDSAAKYLMALVKAGLVRKLGATRTSSVCYCTPENVPATMERIELMKYGSSTGRHMTDEEFEEWTEVVSRVLTCASSAPPVVTNAVPSIFHMAEAMA